MKIKTHAALNALGLVMIFGCLAPAASHADQLFADDVIVQGHLSAGLDSYTNYNFGTDTLVLRENNLRILFNDTSTGSFPSNNWRITINDSTSGGSSYFGIDDATSGKRPFSIMAGAPANALYVSSSGSLGVGTSSPVMKLQLTKSDTPGLRLEQDNTGGFTAQSWDIAGNEANFFIRDVTGGSLLPFRIRPGAPSSTLDLQANGWVGVGTASPHAKLHVEASSTKGEGMIIGLKDSVSTNLATLHVDGSGYFTQKLGIGTNSSAQSTTLYVDGTAFITQTLEIGSSRTRKENIRDVSLEEAQATLKNLNPVQFNYKGDNVHQLGFIAEDVPDLVATKNRKSIVPMDFVAVLTKVVQDHERRETELQQTIHSQQELLKSLSERLSHMEMLVNTHTASSTSAQ